MVTVNMHYWDKYGFFGGHTALDFVNTIDNTDKSRTLNALPDWQTVTSWATRCRLVTDEEEQFLRSAGEQEAELRNLCEFRENLWRVLSKIAGNNSMADNEQKTLNAEIKWMVANANLTHEAGRFRWNTSVSDFGVSLVRARVVSQALSLLESPDLNRVRECGRCTGLFINKGRGVGRRWCRMSTCGNREKINRFRQG